MHRQSFVCTENRRTIGEGRDDFVWEKPLGHSTQGKKGAQSLGATRESKESWSRTKEKDQPNRVHSHEEPKKKDRRVRRFAGNRAGEENNGL